MEIIFMEEFSSEAQKDQEIYNLREQLKKSNEALDQVKIIEQKRIADEDFQVTHDLVDKFGYTPEGLKGLDLPTKRAILSGCSKVAMDRSVTSSASVKKITDSRHIAGVLTVGRKVNGKWVDGDEF